MPQFAVHQRSVAGPALTFARLAGLGVLTLTVWAGLIWLAQEVLSGLAM